MNAMPWKPTWWKDEVHGSAWDRVREAMSRDWTQTKHDIRVRSGHEMNQDIGDTVKQMSGKQPIPPPDKANPPRVIGDLSDADIPMSYGYAAKSQYGKTWPSWNDQLETKLSSEWKTGEDKMGRKWDDVKDHVRYGYEYEPH